MTTFKFKIVLPTSTPFDGDVRSVTVTALDGEWGIYANHAPAVAAIPSGTVFVVDAQGQNHSFGHNEGIMSVGPDGAELLVTHVGDPTP